VHFVYVRQYINCAILVLWKYVFFTNKPHTKGDVYMTISKAQQKATAKYVKNTYDRIEIKVPKGKKQLIQDFATSKGKSLNEFVNTAIDKEIESSGE